jgi:hypothetical protein
MPRAAKVERAAETASRVRLTTSSCRSAWTSPRLTQTFRPSAPKLAGGSGDDRRAREGDGAVAHQADEAVAVAVEDTGRPIDDRLAGLLQCHEALGGGGALAHVDDEIYVGQLGDGSVDDIVLAGAGGGPAAGFEVGDRRVHDRRVVAPMLIRRIRGRPVECDQALHDFTSADRRASAISMSRL